MHGSLTASVRAVSATTGRPSRSTCTAQATSMRPSAVQRRRLAAPASRPRLAAAAALEEALLGPDVPELKMALLDSFWGTERGLAASSDGRAEINELISQLEARNPTPEPNEARAALGGSWRLAYTSNSELIALLALARLPLVRVGEISQVIDPLGQTVENRVELEAPLSKTSLSATASFEVRSPKLLQVSFEEGRVATPQLLADLPLPTSMDLLGQQIDLTPLQAVLQPVEGPLRSALGSLGGLLSQVPDLRIPVRNVQASSWLLTTYLDDTLRITRGDGGSVFVLVRDATPEWGADGGAAATAAAMNSGDWEAMEEREPAAASAAGVDVAAVTLAAAATPEASVMVVEPSAVIEEGEGKYGSNGSLN